MRKPAKFCKNPDCSDEIQDYKSAKKKYCNDYCRNHAGHLRRTKENVEFKIFEKGMKINYTLLQLLKNNNVNKIEFETFEKLGFNTRYLPEQKFYLVDEKKSAVYKIKNITFMLSEDSKKIIILKEN